MHPFEAINARLPSLTSGALGHFKSRISSLTSQSPEGLPRLLHLRINDIIFKRKLDQIVKKSGMGYK